MQLHKLEFGQETDCLSEWAAGSLMIRSQEYRTTLLMQDHLLEDAVDRYQAAGMVLTCVGRALLCWWAPADPLPEVSVTGGHKSQQTSWREGFAICTDLSPEHEDGVGRVCERSIQSLQC